MGSIDRALGCVGASLCVTAYACSFIRRRGGRGRRLLCLLLLVASIIATASCTGSDSGSGSMCGSSFEFQVSVTENTPSL